MLAELCSVLLLKDRQVEVGFGHTLAHTCLPQDTGTDSSKSTNPKKATIHVAQSLHHDIISSSKLGISNSWINRYSEVKPSAITPSYVFEDLKALSILT
jgi:hypothetical protein